MRLCAPDTAKLTVLDSVLSAARITFIRFFEFGKHRKQNFWLIIFHLEPFWLCSSSNVQHFYENSLGVLGFSFGYSSVYFQCLDFDFLPCRSKILLGFQHVPEIFLAMVFIYLILEIIIRVGQNFPRTTSWSSSRCIASPLKLHEVAKRKLDLHVDHQMICVSALFPLLIRNIFPNLVDVVRISILLIYFIHVQNFGLHLPSFSYGGILGSLIYISGSGYILHTS